MLVRERLTGLQAAARRARASSTSGARLSRTRPAAELDKLGGAIEDQRAFAKAVHQLLASLDMASDSRGRGRGERGVGGREQAARAARRRRRRGRASRSPRTRWRWRSLQDSADELEEGAMEAADAPSAEYPGGSRRRRIRGGRRENRPAPSGGPRASAGPTTRPTPTKFDEIVDGRGAVRRPRSCSGCATISTSSCRTCPASSRASPTACSAG